MPNPRRTLCIWSTFLALLISPGPALCAEITVSNSMELRAALSTAGPGTTIQLAPGIYTGGIPIHQKNGAPGQPIVIAAKDPADRPVFHGGGQALHLSDCNYVTLRGLIIRGFSINGINIDDGGTFDTPSSHILLEDMLFEQIGPTGNADGLKMSGVDNFVILRCRFRGWGGSAIDLVGCHRGIVERCSFVGLEGYSQSSGVQLKGGTADVRVLRSNFLNAGQRAINLGGSTGLQFFRPKAEGYEAARIEVAGNRFTGGETAVAFVTSRDSRVHRNTFLEPSRWVLRILQETQSPDFPPCSGGIFENNIILVRDPKTIINIGNGTAPETFTFRRNYWFGPVPLTPSMLPPGEVDSAIGRVPNGIPSGVGELAYWQESGFPMHGCQLGETRDINRTESEQILSGWANPGIGPEATPKSGQSLRK
jgi:hypothetical protein